MRILMIGWYKPQIGGGSHVIQNIVYQLKGSHEIYVINMEEKGLPYLGHWNDNGVEVFQERIYSNLYSPIQTMFQTTKRAILLKRKIKPDLYHVHGSFSAGIGFVDKKTPMVLTMHGYPSLETVAIGRIKPNSIQFNLIRKLEIESAKRADAVIAVDKRIYKWIIEDLNIAPNKVFYLPNAVDTRIFSPESDGRVIRKKYNVCRVPIISFIKGFSPKNGPAIIIKAMKYVVKEYPTAVLLMVGDGPLRPSLEKLVVDHKLEKNVIFTGRKSPEETPSYFAASDIITVPSVHIAGVEEATSLTMLEAMSSGKPVVVSDIGGLKETINDGGNGKIGIVFKENNPKDLALKIISLLDDPKRRRKIGYNARKYVVSKKSWEAYAEKLLDIYEYAIRSKKG